MVSSIDESERERLKRQAEAISSQRETLEQRRAELERAHRREQEEKNTEELHRQWDALRIEREIKAKAQKKMEREHRHDKYMSKFQSADTSAFVFDESKESSGESDYDSEWRLPPVGGSSAEIEVSSLKTKVVGEYEVAYAPCAMSPKRSTRFGITKGSKARIGAVLRNGAPKAERNDCTTETLLEAYAADVREGFAGTSNEDKRAKKRGTRKKRKGKRRRKGKRLRRGKRKSKLASKVFGELKAVSSGGGSSSDGGGNSSDEYDETLEDMYDVLERVFAIMDTSGDGFVDFEEMRRAMSSSAEIKSLVASMPDLHSLLEPKTMRAAFELLDADESGAISFDEFFDGCVFALHDTPEAQMARKDYRELFKMMDKNGDGALDLDEIKRSLRRDPNVMRLARKSEHLRPLLRATAFNNIQTFYDQMDTDGSGMVSWEEFEECCMGTLVAN